VPDQNSSIFLTLCDVFPSAIPLVLVAKIGLVIAAWRMDTKYSGERLDSVSRLTTFLVEFNSQMTIFFTIVCVTIMSTLIRRYALWKAQEGTYVSELEQLQGSISLPSTPKPI